VNNKYRLAVAAALTLFLVPFTACFAQADSHPWLSSKFTVDAGVFFPDSDFELTVEGSIPIEGEDPIDFGRTFGSSADSKAGSLQFTWRFGEKWSLWGQYIEFEDSVASAVLEEDVIWGDYTFGAGTGVAAGSGNAVTRVYFGRHFRGTDHSEFGIGFGVHILDIDAFIAGNAIVNGVPNGFSQVVAKTSGLLPDIGAWYIHAFSPRWAVKTRLDWLGADIGKYDGYILNFALGVNFQMFEHVGVGLNYNWLELDARVNDDPWRGEVLSNSKGLFAYVSAYW